MVHDFLVAEGVLDVPPGTDTRSFFAMEQLFRDVLWPRPKPGWKRTWRHLDFTPGGRKLVYRIHDAPPHSGAGED